MKKTITKFIALSLIGVLSAVANAGVINFSEVRSGGNSFDSIAIDPSTGKVYERLSYTGTQVKVYDNAATFAAGTVASTITLSGSGFYGTYFAVNNGQIYGRTASSGTASATWNAATGAITSTQLGYAGMNGNNGTDTFNWGGYSGVNFMQDDNGIYVLGHSSGTNWQLEQLGTGLASSSTTSLTGLGTLGWGFIINGTLFTGSSFNNNVNNLAINVDSGAISNVNNVLTGLGASYYLSEFSYDFNSDSLYAYNTNSGYIYVANNASQQFGVPFAVPEPQSLALLGIAALGLAFTGKKRRS